MSYLSMLFAAKTQGCSLSTREIRNSQSEIQMEDLHFSSSSPAGPSEQTLPSGVASMEHWLDLNA
jgi:hypothetical protein